MMYELYIANKNYSSWSLRAWVLMRQLGIGFDEHLVNYADSAAWQRLRARGGSGLVPCLIDGANAIWESLAITEYLAEAHWGIWPQDPLARAWARSAAAEMHAGFGQLRERCGMNCGVRARLRELTPALQRDVHRIAELWNQGLQRFGGPFLAGERFTAVDAFFAPVAFRIQSYALASQGNGLAGSQAAGAYAQRVLGLPSMRTWYAEALVDPLRDAAHELELQRFATIEQDLRGASQSTSASA